MLMSFFHPGVQITWIDSCEILGFHCSEEDDEDNDGGDLMGFGTM
jgi:hypothetical protein